MSFHHAKEAIIILTKWGQIHQLKVYLITKEPSAHFIVCFKKEKETSDHHH